jgi:hypothetical protein
VITFRLLVIFTFCWPSFASNTPLDALRLSLIAMRGKPPDYGGPRGATPQLTVAKHQLRDWVESRLPALPQSGDEGEFERKLNSELRGARLFCGEGAMDQQPCPAWTLLGYLDDLKFRRSGGFLILQTGVGIECGFDQSAYIYGWSEEGWRRVWQTEQNAYTEKAYKPQTIHSVQISPYSKGNDYVVLTLGSEPWCSSVLHDVYYRAFRLGPDPEARPLVEGAERAWVGDYPPIRGSVTANEVLVEFTVIGGLGSDNYQAVRHYIIDHDKVERIDPLALRPRDFVSEWLNHDWKESAFWSESANRRLMLEWHRKLHSDRIPGEFIYPTMHCPTKPDLWQVGVDFSDPPTPIGTKPKGTYFLVRWRPPYQFTMVQVGDRPSSVCTEEDRKADDEYRTLFPVQN